MTQKNNIFSRLFHSNSPNESKLYQVTIKDANYQKYLDNMRIIVGENNNGMYSPISLNTALYVFSYLIKDSKEKDSIKEFIGDTDYLSYKTNGDIYTITNRIWANVNKHLKIADSPMKDLFYEIDMSDSMRATKTKDDFVNQTTHGFIKKTPTIFHDAMIMDVMNIIYFKDTWKKKLKSISNQHFYNFDESISKVKMMQYTSPLYYENETCYVIPMKYKTGMRFYAIYPKTTIKDVVLKDVFEHPVPNNAHILIPEFESYFSFDFDDKIIPLGLNITTCDLNIINGFFEPKIIQTTKIKVDCNGTEASAVTEICDKGIARVPKDQDLRLVFNKPFLYMIGDINNDVAFIGQVVSFKERS